MSEAPTPNSPIVIRLFGRTDVGQVREHNEDNFLVADLTTKVRGIREENQTPKIGAGGMVVGVCDGMGGAAAGEVASQLAVDLIYEQLLAGGIPEARDDLARRLVRAIEYAGAHIFHEARADRSRRGMGTTSTIAVFRDRRLFVGQVGDSRAYLLRKGKLVQLTRDQSLVNQLIEAGQLTEEEAETFEHNNIILQALGTAETVQVDLTYVDLCEGDVLLLCSDGLSGMVRNDEILEILSRQSVPLEACRELTDRANAAGGHDNITVIVLRVEGGAPNPGEGDTFGYQKYALPDAPDEVNRVERRNQNFDTMPEGIPSTRADGDRDSRGLRVGHTMIGVMAPAHLATHRGSPQEGTEGPGKGSRVSSERPLSPSRADLEDPVDLPTEGIPPALLATLVISAMMLAALLGYLAMR